MCQNFRDKNEIDVSLTILDECEIAKRTQTQVKFLSLSAVSKYEKIIFLVEDHSLMQQGIINYLCEKSNYECFGSSSDTKGFLEFMAQGKKVPDVLITDLNLNGESELRKAIEAVMTGSLYVEPSLAKTLVSFEHSLSKFTKREISIIHLLMQKCTNVEIAEKLGLNKRTVENNISRIYTKTGLNYKEELLQYLAKEGL